MSTSTTIVIPGRETQTIQGLVMTKSDVIAAYAGDIDLSNMVATEETTATGTVITFANKTGTKGNDIYVSGDLNLSVDGDVVVNNTRIVIPGREAQDIPGLRMTQQDVRAAFAGEIELSGMNCSECVEGDTAVITFSNKTGTKGQTNLLNAIFAAAAEQSSTSQALVEDDVEGDGFDEYYEEDEEVVELRNTLIVIPGREAQRVPGIVMDAQMVKDSFSGDIDLSGYNVEEIENGDTLEVRFTARTGTKGDA